MTESPPDPGHPDCPPRPQKIAADLLRDCGGNRVLALLLCMQVKAILEDARTINEHGRPIV